MRLLATIEYDGTDFVGFQSQKRGRTVQDELERALKQITREKIHVIGAGRTDTGVHALGQAVHLDTAWQRPLPILNRAWNSVLPKDVAVRSIVQVADNFSARYSAKSRAYRYTILNQAIRSPLARRFALSVPFDLDTRAMDDAAKTLLGSHDLGVFGAAPRGVNTTREMFGASVRRDDARVVIDLEANAFLYRMVRRIVGTLILVGRGEMSVEEFREVIAKRRRAGPSVPPQGLCLVAVKYDL